MTCRTETFARGQSSDSAASGGKRSDDCTKPDKFAFWASGSVRFGQRPGSQSEQGNRFDTSGLTVGVDAPVANNLRVGAAVGYGTDRTRLGDDGSASSGSMSSASVYASWKPMPALFIDAVGGYGRLSYNQSRWVGTSDMASALRSGSQWFASLAATTEVKSGQWKLAPYIRADFQSLVLNASSEQTSSVSGLTFDKVKTNSFALATGFRTSYSIPMEWGTLTPNLRMEYRQAFDKGFSQKRVL